MRIAYIVPTPFLPTYVANEIAEVQKAGHAIIIVPLHLTNDPLASRNTYHRLQPEIVLPANIIGINIIFLAIITVMRHPWRFLRTILPLLRAAGVNIYTQAALVSIIPKAVATAFRLRRAQVDHIHAHFATHTATCAGIASKMSQIPFTFTAHAYDIYDIGLKHRNDTLTWKLRHATQMFVVSNHGRRLLCERFPDAADRIHTVYVGIPLELFSETPPRLGYERVRLLCIAYLGEKKGIDILLEACVLLKEEGLPFDLRVYGDGPMWRKLNEKILRHGLGNQVQLSGPISQEEVARQIKWCDIFVTPCRQTSTGDMDGIPTAFMEAMAVGRPVISCPIAGIPELVRHDETGLLVPPDDPAALASAIRRLAQDTQLRAQLGRKARTLVEQQHDQRANAWRLLTFLGGSMSWCPTLCKGYIGSH